MKPIITDDPQIVIERQVEQKRDWSELLSDGMEAREAQDNSQWVLGDLAMEVEKTYGSNEIERYAKDIGVNKETMRRYKTVSKAWPPETRVPYLSHRHHQILASRKDRFELILQVHDDELTTEKLEVEIKKKEGRFDPNLAIASMSMNRGQIEEIIRWYKMIQEKYPELLNEFSLEVYDRVLKFLKKTEQV